MTRSVRSKKNHFVRHSSAIFNRYRDPRSDLFLLNRAEVLAKECSPSPTLKERMRDEGRKKRANVFGLKDFHFFLTLLCVCLFVCFPQCECKSPQQYHRCFIYHVWTPTSGRPAATTVVHHPRCVWARWQITRREQHLQEENQSKARGGLTVANGETCEWVVESCFIPTLSVLYLSSFSQLFVPAHYEVFLLRLNLRRCVPCLLSLSKMWGSLGFQHLWDLIRELGEAATMLGASHIGR